MKKKKVKCATDFCRNAASKGRTICGKCRSKKYSEKNPLRRSYQNLKCNAKRRGKEFTLTFEQFSEFCRQTQYIHKKGRAADAYTIDRIDNERGYTIDNIAVMTKEENSRKGTGQKRKHYDWQHNYARVYETFPREQREDDIF